jgi:hypothetical protein
LEGRERLPNPFRVEDPSDLFVIEYEGEDEDFKKVLDSIYPKPPKQQNLTPAELAAYEARIAADAEERALLMSEDIPRYRKFWQRAKNVGSVVGQKGKTIFRGVWTGLKFLARWAGA